MERDQVTGITPTTLDIGDESFGYIDVNYVVVLFRKRECHRKDRRYPDRIPG